MAVGLGESTPYFLELEALGMVRRTVRKVRETRRNLLTNPSFETGKDGYQSSSSSIASISNYAPMVSHGNQAARVEVFTPDAPNVYLLTSAVLDGPVKAGGEWFAARLDARCSMGSRYTKMRFGYYIGTSLSYGAKSDPVYMQNVNQEQSYSGLIPEGTTAVRVVVYLYGDQGTASPEVGSVFSTDAWALVRSETQAGALGQIATYFDGDTPDAGGWEYRWAGVPHNSTSIAERVEYVDEYGTTADGAPRVSATIYNIDGTQKIDLKRVADGETQFVQGARQVSVTDVGVIIDWAVPLNRETIYTVLVDGEPMSSASITVESDTSWVHDPLHPDTALPIHSKNIQPGALTLAKDALDSGTHNAENTQVMVLGARYPRYYGGNRQATTGVGVPLYSPDEATTDAFLAMVEEAPILVFRPAKRLRPLPAVAYLAADVEELPLNQDPEDVFTKWVISGNLVQAVLQAALSGYATYQDVQNLLGEYTYGEVQEAASSTLYIDWQKNPLIFTYL